MNILSNPLRFYLIETLKIAFDFCTNRKSSIVMIDSAVAHFCAQQLERD